MDSPQYLGEIQSRGYDLVECFKPYYKWIVLNTRINLANEEYQARVLNLIING